MKRILIFCITVFLTACSSEQKAIPDLSVSPETIELSGQETTKTIYVISNASWVAKSSHDWCKTLVVQNFGSDTTELKISENTLNETRTAYVSFSVNSDKIIKTVKIIQHGISLRSSDSLALVNFYDATDGDSWNVNTGWKNANLDEWHGITVENNRVTAIKFENNNLSGNLAAVLEKLTMLDTISLVSEPFITGDFPVEITRLSNLRYINFTGTSIGGNIPAETGGMTSLRTLVLSSNPMLNKTVPIPVEIGNLSGLTMLKLDSVAVDPAVLTNLANLEYLSLDSCKIRGEFPACILDLTNIKYLSLKNNLLYGDIPPALSKLTKIENLILSSNRFSGEVPNELTLIPNLKELRIENNYLGGLLPLLLLNIENVEVCPQIGTGFTNKPCDSL